MCEDIAMCVSPCFELFHMQIHYCKTALELGMANEMQLYFEINK